MIARSAKGKILVFLVFFIGIATGVLLANFYDSRVTSPGDAPAERAQRAQRDINTFYDYLGLNEEQRAQARKIGVETQEDFRKLREETQPQFERIQQESRTKIRALLTEEQRLKYDEFRKRRDERFKNRDRDNRDSKRDSNEKPN